MKEEANLTWAPGFTVVQSRKIISVPAGAKVGELFGMFSVLIEVVSGDLQRAQARVSILGTWGN